LEQEKKLKYPFDMTSKHPFPQGEENFNKWLVSEYFKNGTVEAVFRKYRYDIPISYAQYQRVLDKWGIVKTAGPNSKLAESLEFFSYLAKENIPFEKLYKKMPPSFRTSAVTLYRILGYMKEGITRRIGVALVLTPYNSNTKVLIAHDISTPRIELGKSFGSISLPMGYARKRDTREVNILRILQQEVFTKDVIGATFPHYVIPEFPEPFMYLDIADVRVSVFHITLPKNLSRKNFFSSYKLKDYLFEDKKNILENIQGRNYRAGVVDAVKGYSKYLGLVERNLVINPLQTLSLLNKDLATITVDLEI